MNLRPKQSARLGEFYLEEAVLDVLLAARHTIADCLGPAEISKRAGIFRQSVSVSGLMHDAITAAILAKLLDQNRVERCTQPNSQRGGWRLSDMEFSRRRDDIE